MNHRIIEIDDQRFIVTERDAVMAIYNEEQAWHLLGEYCNLMAAQDVLLRRGVLAWATYLKADGCTCSEHSDEEEVNA
jgi:hypothetical protein